MIIVLSAAYTKDGWDGLDCPDKQLIEGLVQREWEDWKIVEALNEGLIEAEISIFVTTNII